MFLLLSRAVPLQTLNTHILQSSLSLYLSCSSSECFVYISIEMEDQYGLGDLRQFINGEGRPLSSSATILPAPRPEQLLDTGHHYEMIMMMERQSPSSSDMMHSRTGVQFHSSSPNLPAAGTTTSATCMSNASLYGLEMEIDALGGDGSTGRWPRQETLTLLEIRSRLDSMFKEANQKAPLWDEVSRIMSEEHGYQRSGKKCREKFENLYKYYKKTKDGKAGRQDGKHYRFFRQLEALYGETSNPTPVSEKHGIGSTFPYNAVNRSVQQHNQEAFQIQAPRLSNSLTLSNSSGFDTSSSEESDLNAATLMQSDSLEKRKKRRSGKISLKAKIKDIIDAKMRKLMDKQEEWMENIMKTIEDKEQERILREEEWRRQEETRIDREDKLWAIERARIEAWYAAVMETLQKLTGKELKESEEMGVNELRNLRSNRTHNGIEAIISILKGDSWTECEITKLVQMRTSMETSFQEIRCSEEALWEEIAAKMSCSGYDRKGWMCKDKWNNINNYLMMYSDGGKKGVDNSGSCYLNNNESVDSQGNQGMEKTRVSSSNDHHVASPPNTGRGNAIQDSCFRYLMSDGQKLWQNYTLKRGNEENN